MVQLLQARIAVRGWVRAALPLGVDGGDRPVDEIGDGYLHTLVEALIISLYERAHGAVGEGGGGEEYSFYHCRRLVSGCGLHRPSLEFLSELENIEEEDHDVGAHGAVLGALPEGMLPFLVVIRATNTHNSSTIRSTRT